MQPNLITPKCFGCSYILYTLFTDIHTDPITIIINVFYYYTVLSNNSYYFRSNDYNNYYNTIVTIYNPYYKNDSYI